MVRTILLLIVAAFVAAPASALDLAPLSQATPDAPLEVGADDLGDATKQVTQTVQDTLRCQKAVKVEMQWWEGVTTDTRERERELLAAITDVVETVVGWEPVTETTEETGGGALNGLLGGLPVVQTVTRIVGWEPVTQIQETQLVLPVGLAWKEEYIDWTHHQETLYLTLPAGLPLVANGQGDVVDLCEPATILSALPQPCDTDGWCSPVVSHDGWYSHVPLVRLITEPGDDLPLVDADGFIVGASPLLDLLEASGLVEHAAAPEQAPSVEQQSSIGEVTDRGVAVDPAKGAGMGAVVAGVVAMLGVARRLLP